MPRPYRLGLMCLTWWGAYLRFQGLFVNTFHTDEALFASWARLIATWRDPLLQTAGVDKPPLLFYLQALFYRLGAVEWAARLPNLLVSICLIPLVGVWVYQLTKSYKRSWLAAGLVACSPLAIQFSSTAFIDPLLTFLLILGLYAIGRPGKPALAWGWFCLGLALTAKYQAVLFFPLALFWSYPHKGKWSALGVFLLPVLALLAWEYGRVGGFTLWSSQMQSYGGVRLAWSWELWPRLWQWVDLLWYTLGWGALIALPFLVISLTKQSQLPTPYSPLPAFILLYLLTHWLLAIPTWDRYLLPLVPLLALWLSSSPFFSHLNEPQQILINKKTDTEPVEVPFLSGYFRPSTSSGGESTPFYSRKLSVFIFHILYFIFFISQSLTAGRGLYPVGSTPQADQGARQIALYLQNEPYGTVLYDHWYSWQWRYYFFDKGVYVSWFAHPAVLAEELTVFGADQRYVVLPAGEVARPVFRQAEAAGFELVVVKAAGEMVLYEVRPGKK